MKKKLLTPKIAEKIQNEIYYNMSDEKKIRIVSQFFVLANTLRNSKTILKDESRRVIGNNK